MKILACTIDLMKIDKSRIKTHPNGAKYYPITVIVNDEPDKYGQNVSISNGQTKEEREAKTKQTYIGNGKTVYEKRPEGQQPQASTGTTPIPESPLSQHNSNYDPDLGF